MKRIITAILIMAMSLTVLSGCYSEQRQTDTGGESTVLSDSDSEQMQANTDDESTESSNSDFEQKQANISGELSVATFNENSFLDFAARKYEEMNDGVTITINTYASDNESDISKYSQIINTALMSGSGEDIIDVSVIDWVTLADSGKLVDLNGKISFGSEDYYQNILDAYLYDGGRYAIPLSFYYTAFRFDDSFSHSETPAMLTLEGLMSLAARYPENPLVVSGAGLDAILLAHMMFYMDFDEFIDTKNKTASIDNEKFIDLLKNIKSLNNLRWPEKGETAVIWEIPLYNPAMSLQGTIDYSEMFLLTNDKGKSLFYPIGFLPSVNANSANQELAVDFMRFLLSEEMQSSAELLFNPVNKKASAEMASLVLADAQAGGYVPEDFSLDKNIAKFNDLAESLAVARHSDSFIEGFLIEEITRFFNGDISAEETAKNLQSRLNTYLKE